jgi:RHS repeat-associated protein
LSVPIHKTAPQNHPISWSFSLSNSNGKEKDYESGFHYYGARYYWSELLTGWLSVDPMSDKYPNISPYNYCSLNPVKYIDPDGEEKLIFFKTKMPYFHSFRGSNALNQYTKAMGQYKSNMNLKRSANKYQDNDKVIHLFAHGGRQVVNLAEKGKKNASELETFLANNSQVYKENIGKGETSLLIMHSCKTGGGKNSIAQQLSELAKGDLLIFAPSDNITLGDKEKVNNNGVWNVFYKGELIGKYKGNTEFGRELQGKNVQDEINKWKRKYESNHTND